MQNVLLENLHGVCQETKAEVKPREPTVVRAITIFDLCGSTELKLDSGPTLGTRIALTHNLLCRKIVEIFGGRIVKELGDGVLCDFEDPLKACLSALNIKKACTSELHISTKAALTVGAIELIRIDGIPGILGAPVDRCAHIPSEIAHTSCENSLTPFLHFINLKPT